MICLLKMPYICQFANQDERKSETLFPSARPGQPPNSHIRL